jgi:hypothetical protein
MSGQIATLPLLVEKRSSARPAGVALTEERMRLRSQGMLGFVLLYPDRNWNGQIFATKHSCERTLKRDPGAWLLMVNTSGTVFYEKDSRATQRVGSHPGIPSCLDVRPVTRRRLKRAADARAFH